MLKGENLRLFSVCRSSKDIAKWLGFKQISWGETLIPKEQFKDVEDKYQLEVIVRDVKPDAKVFLRQNKNPEEGQRDRPALSSDKPYGNIINLTEGADEMAYVFTINAAAAQELKNNGLAVTGNGYYLRSVRLINNASTAVNNIITTAQHDGAVYTLDGIKVADWWGAKTLTRGVYIVDGRKVIIK